ncbi:hypothetical protein BO79DRAFT_287197 [Aspergillus costaricaensis CBS 115574]|uniref:Uncharacterized protein n=1 Tax=Aspergillus costaricaensis CBS 115574 TaxID=1448317 RepID=A0ACD1IG83_9EURO|nr:hypothetical protein BO79DRAFT_287197 [Aspergillus costaricaensis CBS 115574]RAK89105.1 hypothetical protein BO79DRAFT_287197 [Aspergillus costaricaensis CBS 115574]
MSTFFLFCTADIPASILNDFMDQFRKVYDDNMPNLMCVVRSPDQSYYPDWGTELPISDFLTGFKDATNSELRAFTQAKIAELGARGEAGSLEPDWIAVMDERSLRDRTVVMQFNMEMSMWAQDLEDADEPFEIPGNADIEGDDIWWKWRVLFSGAQQIFNSIDCGDPPMIQLYSRPEYLGSDGVVKVDVIRKTIRGDR